MEAWEVLAREINGKIARLKKDLEENAGGQRKQRLVLNRLEKWVALTGSERGYRKKQLPRFSLKRGSGG